MFGCKQNVLDVWCQQFRHNSYENISRRRFQKLIICYWKKHWQSSTDTGSNLCMCFSNKKKTLDFYKFRFFIFCTEDTIESFKAFNGLLVTKSTEGSNICMCLSNKENTGVSMISFLFQSQRKKLFKTVNCVSATKN